MVKSIVIVLTKSPYGSVATVGGLMSALATSSHGVKTTIVFMDDAILSLTKNQRPDVIRMASVQGLVKAMANVRLAVHLQSLEERGLTEDNLMSDVKLELLETGELAKLVAEADVTFTL
ncbi:MAG: DsrE family protein [Candidatus Nezhaarchaeales archaeon]